MDNFTQLQTFLKLKDFSSDSLQAQFIAIALNPTSLTNDRGLVEDYNSKLVEFKALVDALELFDLSGNTNGTN